ncbi:MAG: dual specificity protein phosphatase family protein [Anaerolineae bacterium]|nr:dual specificity protein phosphatase family protein [Anaerolineae bacterium]
MLSTFVPVDLVGHGIYISGHRATQYTTELRAANIKHVLKLYSDIPYFPHDFTVLENAIEDGESIPPNKLREGVQFVMEQVEAKRSVLVMCGAGISRSSTFVLASLLQLDYTLEDAYRLLKSQHSSASPHPALWNSLINHYRLPYRVEDVLGWSLD